MDWVGVEKRREWMEGRKERRNKGRKETSMADSEDSHEVKQHYNYQRERSFYCERPSTISARIFDRSLMRKFILN